MCVYLTDKVCICLLPGFDYVKKYDILMLLPTAWNHGLFGIKSSLRIYLGLGYNPPR